MSESNSTARPKLATWAWGAACFGVVLDAILVATNTIKTEQGWLVLAAAGVLALASQIDRLTELSGLGVSAKLREKIAEADATIQDAREIFATLSRAILTDLIAGDFMSGMGTQRRLDLHDEVMRELRDAKLTRSQLERAEAGWKGGMEMMFNRLFRRLLDERLAASAMPKEDQGKVSAEFRKLLDFDQWMAGSPTDYRQLFERAGLLDAEVLGWVSDFQHYRDTAELRRRDAFLELVYWRERRDSKARFG